jgi:hypothetical protein
LVDHVEYFGEWTGKMKILQAKELPDNLSGIRL